MTKVLVIFCILFTTTIAANILAIFPYPSHSHQVVNHAVVRALAQRGHTITVFTMNPMNETIENFTEISMSHIGDEFLKRFNYYHIHEQGFWGFISQIYEFGGHAADEFFSDSRLKSLITKKTEAKLDLIISASVYWDAFYYLSVHFGVPMVGISSLPTLAVHNYIMGNPMILGHLPDAIAGHHAEMNFFERLHNFYFKVRQIYEFVTINHASHDKVLRKHFGEYKPSVLELPNKLDILLVNEHPHLSYPRPTVPGMIYIGGCRMGLSNKTLPANIKSILDAASNGFIYFNLGSNVKSSQLPGKTLNAILKAFRELPYKVIWKFESEHLPGKPDNVFIRKWMPQNGILAHPNIKLFIYQGGMQSTEEAIENAVPVIGCPFFSDQESNVRLLIKRGVAKQLNVLEITTVKLKNAILEVISNKSYKENMIKLKDLILDRPRHPMDEAIWWIEHVIRHKGAAHLNPLSRSLPWYIRETIDILGFVFITLILIMLAICMLLWLIVKKMKLYLVTKKENLMNKKNK